MKESAVWTIWKVTRQNTAEIARELKLSECDVEQVIWTKMNEQHTRRKKPFREVTA